jgi:hypothetical protein
MKVALVGTAAAVAVMLGACGSSPKATVSAPSAEPAPAVSSASLSPERAETIYLDATAAHLCAVQSRVYTDPKELADAYSTPPPYPQLSTAQVTAFNQRVTSDAAFATRLTDRVKSTCGTAPTVGPASPH